MEGYLYSYIMTTFVYVRKNFEGRTAKIETIALQIPVKTALLVPKFLVRLNATVLMDFLVLSVKSLILATQTLVKMEACVRDLILRKSSLVFARKDSKENIVIP